MKSQAAKSKKTKQKNPEHPAYVAAMKGMQSAVVDFDYFKFDDGATLVVVGEEASSVRAFITKDISKESEQITS